MYMQAFVSRRLSKHAQPRSVERPSIWHQRSSKPKPQHVCVRAYTCINAYPFLPAAHKGTRTQLFSHLCLNPAQPPHMSATICECRSFYTLAITELSIGGLSVRQHLVASCVSSSLVFQRWTFDVTFSHRYLVLLF